MRRLLILSSTVLLGCSPLATGQRCSKVNQSRCTVDNRVELCGPNGQWMTIMDCQGEMGSDWFCAPTAEGHSCVRKEQKK